MRITFTLLAVAGAVVCQDLSSLPPCGRTCITNMISVAQSEFGCSAGDVFCYCEKPEFGYGVRDCSNEACANEEEANQVIAYGNEYCENAESGGVSSAAATTGAVPILSSALSGTGPASTPVSTTALVGYVTSDGSTFEATTGFSTIYAVVGSATSGLASVTGSAGSAISSVASSAASEASSAASSAESVASSVAESASSAIDSAASSATATDTGNAAPMLTAFPMAGAAGVAALLLI